MITGGNELLLLSEFLNYEDPKKYSLCKIGDKNGITVKLCRSYLINQIKFVLEDMDYLGK